MDESSASEFSLLTNSSTLLSDEPTVFVVDDDHAVGVSLKTLLNSMGMRVKSYSSGEEFLQDYDGSHGCLVTDVRMPTGLSGTDLQNRLSMSSISLPVIIITAFAETSLTVQAMQNGAIALLEKPYRDHELLDAVRAALQVDRKQRQQERETREVFNRLDSLSECEMAVLDLIIDGVTNKVIASQLDVSIRTIENRRKRIYEKMNTDSIAALVRMIVEARVRSKS